MTDNFSQLDLADAPQVDWKDFEGGKWQAPPPAVNDKEEPIVYYGKASGAVMKRNDYALDPETGKPLLNYALENFTITQGPYAGQVLKFVEVNVKPFPGSTRHTLGQFLRAAGVTAKPQTNAEYIAAMKLAATKQVPFVLDWEAKDKETGEQLKGALAFPIGSDGKRKAILKQGDFYNILDQKRKPTGQTAQVKAEVLFANPRLRYFRDQVK